MAKLLEITQNAFADAYKNTFRSIGPWLGMAALTLFTVFVPAVFAKTCGFGIEMNTPAGITLLIIDVLVWIFLTGVYVKPLRLEKADFKNPGKTFVQGILFSLIYLIWTIIPLLLSILLFYGGVVSGALLSSQNDLIPYYIALGFGWVLAIAVYLLFCVIWVPAEVGFAQNGRFRDAFTFAKYLEQIQAVGIARFLLGLLLVICLEAALLFTLFCGSELISLIPAAGPWLGMLMISAFLPYFWIFGTSFAARLIAEADHD